MTDSEFFKEVCQWHDGNCRKSIKWGDKGWACCSKSVCPSICPLKKVFPDRCSNPPDECKYFLCNVAKIYIMQHPHLHEHYIDLLKRTDKLGIEYNKCQ